MASKADIANDRVQQSTDATDALAYLMTLHTGVIRAVADLNHIDPDGLGRLPLARAIVADRWPTRD